MKSILRLSIIILLAAVGSMLSAADSAQIDAEMKRVEALDRALDAGGITELLATAMPCPLIHSNYFAEKLATREPELRALEQAKRDLGLKLARVLDETAGRLQQRTDSEERAKQAAQLLDLAAWVKAAKGYGNYLLLSRCESLATVPLAYLTADLDYPIGKVSSLRGGLTSEETDRTFRIAVLNAEAPQPFIGPLNGSESDKDDQMEMIWNKGWHAVIDWFKEHGTARDAWQRTLLPERLAFFLDDELRPDPLTTVTTWSLKRHRSIIFSNRDVQVKNVDEFIQFREKVGAFPTQPPQWWKPNANNPSDTALRAAFQEASKHLRRENGQTFGYSMPAILYQEVSDGKVLDHETQLVRFAEAQERTQSGKQ